MGVWDDVAQREVFFCSCKLDVDEWSRRWDRGIECHEAQLSRHYNPAHSPVSVTPNQIGRHRPFYFVEKTGSRKSQVVLSNFPREPR